jgi:Flp pilus assembly protein TadD
VGVAWGVAGIVERWPRVRPAAVAASAAVLLALAGVARAQVETWRDAETVNRHALAHTERNWVAWQGLGDALWRAGRPREAAEAFEEALRIRPDDAHALNGLGALYGSEGRPDLALGPLQRAVQVDPGHPDGWYNLGTALGQLGRPADAIRCFRTAVQLVPDHAGAWFNLGVASLAVGDRAGAAESARRLARLDPGQAAELARRVTAARGSDGAPGSAPTVGGRR